MEIQECTRFTEVSGDTGALPSLKTLWSRETQESWCHKSAKVTGDTTVIGSLVIQKHREHAESVETQAQAQELWGRLRYWGTRDMGGTAAVELGFGIAMYCSNTEQSIA